MAIEFYRISEPFGCFSNFYPAKFVLDGLVWNTSEHYFQAQKFVGSNLFEQIKNAPNPMTAAKLGRSRAFQIREDWEDIKDSVMRKCVYAKFTQNPDILAVLLSTYGQELVERTTDDYYWGCGSNRTGKNRLGQILMEVRDINLSQTENQ